MNEFIVYNDKNDFIGNEHIREDGRWSFVLNNEGLERSGTISPALDEKLYRHRFIGKTDIDGKKIYADCSVVEFDDYSLITGVKKDAFRATFTYSKKHLGYIFKLIKQGDEFINDEMLYYKDKVKNLKVIGTLQEKPELIGANNERATKRVWTVLKRVVWFTDEPFGFKNSKYSGEGLRWKQ